MTIGHRSARDYYALVDGGVFANNPTSLALMETMISYKRKTQQELHRAETLVVSLGTGSATKTYKYQDAVRWGQIQWAFPLLNIVLDGQSEAVAFQLSQLMITEGDEKNYYRFQEQIDSENGHDQMDNASPDNINYLIELGKTLIKKEKKSLDQLCEVLCQPLEQDS